MIAIETKYLGPTNTRGSRIKASIDGGRESVTVPYNHQHDTEDNHAIAALALARKMRDARIAEYGAAHGWDGDLIAAHTSRGYVFVFAHGERFPI